MTWFSTKCKHNITDLRNIRLVGHLGAFAEAFIADATCSKCKTVYCHREDLGPAGKRFLTDRFGVLADKELEITPGQAKFLREYQDKK